MIADSILLEAQIEEYRIAVARGDFTAGCGACAEIFFTGVTTAQHEPTCPGSNNPAVIVQLDQAPLAEVLRIALATALALLLILLAGCPSWTPIPFPRMP